jgi:hypothetical protein
VEQLAVRLPAAGSQATVRKALVELAREGVVRRIKRKGTVVRSPAAPRAAARWCSAAMPTSTACSPSRSTASLHDAGYDVEVVPFATDARLVAIHCQRLTQQHGARLDCAVVINPPHPYDRANADRRESVEAYWQDDPGLPAARRICAGQ